MLAFEYDPCHILTTHRRLNDLGLRLPCSGQFSNALILAANIRTMAMASSRYCAVIVEAVSGIAIEIGAWLGWIGDG